MSTQSTKQSTSIVTQIQSTSLPVEPVIEQKSFIDSISQFFNSNKNNVVSSDQITWTDLFASSNTQQLKKNWKLKREQYKDADVNIANSITQFKQDYIITIGDIRVRSVLMAFSAALFYKTISLNTTGLFRKTRNLGVSFAFMGYWFVPELFNPFLQKPRLIQNIV